VDETALSWEDPPLRTRYDWNAIAAELTKRPGEWAKVFENDRKSLAVAIRVSGISALLPANGFEVRTRNNTKDTPPLCTMYLRYNPALDQRVPASSEEK